MFVVEDESMLLFEFVKTIGVLVMVFNEDVIRIAKEYKIELNRWFFDISPYYYSDSCKLVQNKCAKQIGKEIFNLPVYWTLTKKELLQIEKFLKVVSKYLVKSDE